MIVSELTRRAGAERYGVDPRSLHEKGGTDGAVYSCRRGSRACVLKFVPMPDDQLVVYEEKLAFIAYLAEHGVPLAAPLESDGGKWYEVVQGEDRQYVVTLTQLADGRHPTPRNLYDWNETLFQLWGQVMGKMHALAKVDPTWRRPAPGDLADQPPTRLTDWQGEHCSFAEWCTEPKIVEKWMQLYEELKLLPIERSGYGLIHNDLHMWNFLYNPDARDTHPITIIDFDVCGYHWFITDIAIAVYHGLTWTKRSLAEREIFTRHFLSHFMRGYRKENALDPCWFEHLPTFLKYREILVYIALSNEWPEEKRDRWQKSFLAEKRSRTLRDEPLITQI